MIKYIRLYDGKVYSSYEECEKDATSILIEPVDRYTGGEVDVVDLADKIYDTRIEESKKHKKIKHLFNL